MDKVPQELKNQMTADHHRAIVDHLAALCDKNPSVTISIRRSGDNYMLTVSARQYADTDKKKIVPPLTMTGKPDQLSAGITKLLEQLEKVPEPVSTTDGDGPADAGKQEEKKPAQSKTEEKPKEDSKPEAKSEPKSEEKIEQQTFTW